MLIAWPHQSRSIVRHLLRRFYGRQGQIRRYHRWHSHLRRLLLWLDEGKYFSLSPHNCSPICKPPILITTFFPCQFSSQSKSASPPATRTTRSIPSPPPPPARSTWCSPNPPRTSRMRTSLQARRSWRYIPRIRHRRRRIRNALRRRGSSWVRVSWMILVFNEHVYIWLIGPRERVWNRLGNSNV